MSTKYHYCRKLLLTLRDGRNVGPWAPAVPWRFSQLLPRQLCGGEPQEWGILRAQIPCRIEPKQVKGRTVEATWETGGNNGKFIWLNACLNLHKSCPSSLVGKYSDVVFKRCFFSFFPPPSFLSLSSSPPFLVLFYLFLIYFYC